MEECELREQYAAPHADGSSCICRHVTCSSRDNAEACGGRYWDGSRWVCLGGCRAEEFRAQGLDAAQAEGVVNNAELAAADEQYEESDARECVVATLDGDLDITPDQDAEAVVADAMALWIETFRTERLFATLAEVAP